MEKAGLAFDIPRFQESIWTRLLCKAIPPKPHDQTAASAEAETTSMAHADFRFQCQDTENPTGVILCAARPQSGVKIYDMCTLGTVNNLNRRACASIIFFFLIHLSSLIFF